MAGVAPLDLARPGRALARFLVLPFFYLPLFPSCVCHLPILSPQLLPSFCSPSRGIPSFSPTSLSSAGALEFSPGLRSKVVFFKIKEAVSPFVFKPSRLSDLGLQLMVCFLVFLFVVIAKRPSGIQIEWVKQTWEKGLVKGKAAGLSGTGTPR